MKAIDDIGTDPEVATNFAGRKAYASPETKTAVAAADVLKTVRTAVIKRWYDINMLSPAQRADVTATGAMV